MTSENELRDLIKTAALDNTSMSVNTPKKPSRSNQASFTLGLSTCNEYTYIVPTQHTITYSMICLQGKSYKIAKS